MAERADVVRLLVMVKQFGEHPGRLDSEMSGLRARGAERSLDRRGRHVYLRIAGEKHREAFGDVRPLLPQAHDEGLELRRNAVGTDRGPRRYSRRPGAPSFRYASSRSRAYRGRSRRSTTDVIRHLLIALNDPQPPFRPPGLLRLPGRHPGPPFSGHPQHIPAVQE